MDDLRADEILKDTKTGETYADNTKIDFLKISKPFFSWSRRDDPGLASWIKTGSYHPVVTPEDILTTDERTRINELCKTPRDRALFNVGYESAARPKDLLALRKLDIQFEEDCAVIVIKKGKGGFPRSIPLLQDAFPLLKNWVFNENPLRDQTDFPIWVDMSSNSTHDPLQQVGYRRFIERLAKAARIEKRVSSPTL